MNSYNDRPSTSSRDCVRTASVHIHVPQNTLGMLGGPPTRSGFPPPSGRVTPPRILELNGESYRLEHSKKARPPAAAPVP